MCDREQTGEALLKASIAAAYRLHTVASRAEVYSAIDGERDYQDAGKGNARRHPESPKAMSVGEFILCMEEYLAKARLEWAKAGGIPLALHDIRKVTALGVQCMELHGAPRRALIP